MPPPGHRANRAAALPLLLVISVPVAGIRAQGDWRPRRYLDGRTFAGMAWDAARERIVLFGGESYGNPGETWEMVGSTWTQRAPATSPRQRVAPAMSYDPLRQRVLLFGGVEGPTPLADTWEWDGFDWRQRMVNFPPPARHSAMMVWDELRARGVLFGGMDSSAALGDTWEWDGNTWLQRTPAASPSPRGAAAMAYDAARQRTVLFGGGDYNTVRGETWEWDGTNWLQLFPATSPVARSAAAAAYDRARQRVVLACGYSGAIQRLADTWEWDGTSWTRATATLPAGRAQCSAAFHAGRQRVVLHGGGGYVGNDPTAFRETWEWDGTAWSLLPQVTEPPVRLQTAIADGIGGPVLMFSGANTSGGYLADTWEWRRQQWRLLTPATNPPARRMAGMARDLARQRVVLFGGIGAGYVADTWEWTGTDWQAMTPLVSPPPRAGHALAFDPVRYRVLLFGGGRFSISGSIDFGDTWSWDGAAWTQLFPPSSPAPRTGHTMAADFGRGRIVLFGGSVFGTTFGDTWEWDGTNWLQRTPAVSPPARFAHAMAYDPSRRRTVVHAGLVSPLLGDDTWEWDGTNWTQPTLTRQPSPRRDHAMAYDAEQQRLLTYGGDLVRTTWLFGAARDASAQPIGTGCLGTAGVPVLGASVPYVGSREFGLDLGRARPAAPAFFGLSPTARTLPLGSGCSLHVVDPSLVFALTSSTGFATQRMTVPANPALRGSIVFAQAVVLDAQGAFAGLAFSGGLALTLGD